MRIPLDRTSSVPLYRQLVEWFRDALDAGVLAPGTKLPSSRSLAAELGVARVTVTGAYAELESQGLLTTREGGGTFAAARPHTPPARPAAPEAPRLPRQSATPAHLGGVAAGEVAEPAPPRVPRIPAVPHDLIGFAGVGDPRLFPAREFAAAVRDVVRRDPGTALAYCGDPLGHAPLRETITLLLASQGIRTEPDHVMVTSGSQQALALVCQTLLRPGDAVLVESPTYDVALQLFRSLDVTVVGAPSDVDGLVVEQIEPLLQRHHPKLVYTVPNFANPTGACMTAPRRRMLLELATRYNTPIVEDDFAGDLRFEGRAQPAIRALDQGGHVIYTGTFSKLVMPGLRLGYLVADPPLLTALAERKRVVDLGTPTLLQHALERYVSVGRYQSHLRRTTRAYRARRDTLLAALAAEAPALTVDVPHGGLFAWVGLPEGASATRLLTIARAHGVGFGAGTRFHVDPQDGEDRVRLNFAAHTPEEITEGVRRLRAALRAR